MHDHIPFQQTGLLQNIVSDYLFQSSRLSAFYQYHAQPAYVSKAIDRRSNQKVNRDLLVSVISKQYSGIELTHAVSNQISKLKLENTFTITTAHQPNLLGGPLYVIHKIASVVKLTQDLNKQYSDKHFVPVFWMGSEDHDKEELAHINLFGKHVIWNTAQSGAFGRFHLNDIDEVRQKVFETLGNSDSAARVKDWLDNIYFGKATIEQATRSMLHSLFGEYGLVIIHGDDAELKRAFISLMEDELRHQTSKQIVDHSIQQLEASGYEAQAVPREINLFYLNEQSRLRIQQDTQGFKAGEKIFSQQEILNELHQHPQCFSPNVILRPLYQALILPDIVFAGGGAEIAYHLQLKKLFDHYQLHFPIIVLRDTAIYIQESWRNKLNKSGFTIADLFKPIQELTNSYIKQHSDINADFSKEKQDIESVFSKLIQTAASSDNTLRAYANAELKKALQSVDAIAEKILRSEKRKSEEGLQQLIKLREQILPNNILQERYNNFLPYYMKHGDDYIKNLIENFDAWDTQLKVMHFN